VWKRALVQVAEGTVLGGLRALEDARQKAYAHDVDALLGAQPPPFVGCVHCAPFIARRTACADL
jgi:hypothetical protein